MDLINARELYKSLTDEVTGKPVTSIRTFPQVQQTVPQATTIIPLGAGEIWNSGIVDVSEYGAIASILKSDVAGTLSAVWYADVEGTIEVRSFSSPYEPNETPDVFQGTNKVTNYIELTYTNGPIAQTEFAFEFFVAHNLNAQHLLLNSFLSANAIAQVTRSVTAGKDKDGVYRNAGVEKLFDDQYGLQTSTLIRDKDGSYAGISNFSEVKTAERRIDVEAKFYYNINTLNLTTELGPTGAASVIDRQAVLSTGTDPAGSASIETKQTPSYIVSQDISCSNTFVFPDVTGAIGAQVGVENCLAKVGLINTNDEISFGFDGNTTFNIFIKRSGVTLKINQANFSIDKLDGDSEYTPDWTKLQLLRFNYSWHGVTPFVFQIQDTRGTWRTFHVESFVNKSPLSSIGTPSLPLRAVITNTGSTSNNSLIWQAGQVSVIGTASDTAASRHFTSSTSRALIAATTTVLLSVRSKATFVGQSNFINSALQLVSLATNGNKSVVFRVIKNGTLTGAVFADVDSVNSVMEFDTTATAIAGGKEVAFFPLASTAFFIQPVLDLDININPNDTLTLVALSSNANDVDVGLRWDEIH